MRFHLNTSCEQVEAAKLRLLTLAPLWEGSQNRKYINGLVNGGLQRSKVALRYAARGALTRIERCDALPKRGETNPVWVKILGCYGLRTKPWLVLSTLI